MAEQERVISLSDKQEQRAEAIIIGRFYSRITLHDLYRWLSNFLPSEIDYALTILEHFEYFREEDLAAMLNNYLANAVYKISRNVGKNVKLHILPLGKAGKSGHVISYIVKNNLKYTAYNGLATHQYYEYAGAIDVDSLSEQDVVIFVDDFIGSGDSFVNMVRLECTIKDEDKIPDSIWGLKKFFVPDVKCHLLLLAGVIMENGGKRLKRTYPQLQICGEVRKKCFDPHESIFGSYLRMKELREFCWKYGNRLVGTRYLNESGRLGYGNSQSLIAFAHAVPNNTLPVIWASACNDGEKWTPLIARQYEVRNELAYTSRSENARWMFQLRNLLKLEEGEYIPAHRIFTIQKLSAYIST